MAPKVTISLKHCKGCKLCLTACPRKALKLTGRRTHSGVEIIAWDASLGCSLCLLCTATCPDAAITIEEVPDDAGARSRLVGMPAEPKKGNRKAK